MKKTNLIYIFADQWRAQAIGAAGEDSVNTPNMDAFAEESMACANAVSTYPLCSPHRACLLTGKYPLSCGMWTNCKTGLDEVVMLKPQEVTISDVLSQVGYQTAYIGKWHLDGSEQNFRACPASGASGWDAYTPPGERRHHFDYWVSYGAMDDHLAPHYWKDGPEKIEPGMWSVEYETDLALDYLKGWDGKRPFCLFLSWNPPHPPYDQVPERYWEPYRDRELPDRPNVPEAWRRDPEYQRRKRQYFAAVSGLDGQFGRLMGYLRETGLEKETLVVLSADHGDCMGSHGRYGKNIWYEESIRIPLYFRGPGIAPGRTDVLFSSPDHMPTILELLGEEIPETVEGAALGRFVRGGGGEEPKSAYLCMMPGMPELVEPYRKLGLNPKAFGWRGIRTKEITYIVDRGCKPGEPVKRWLYDLVSDPYQLSPRLLTLSDPEAVRYERVLNRWLKERRDPFLTEELPGENG